VPRAGSSPVGGQDGGQDDIEGAKSWPLLQKVGAVGIFRFDRDKILGRRGFICFLTRNTPFRDRLHTGFASGWHGDQ